MPTARDDCPKLNLQFFILRPSQNYTQCVVDGDASKALLIISLIYKGLLCLNAVFWAWKSRNIKQVLFNESQFIGYAVYNLSAFSIIVIVLIGIDPGDDRELVFWLTRGAILLGVMISVHILFVPKIVFMARGLDMDSGSDFTSSGGGGGSKSQLKLSKMSRSTSDEDVASLKKRIKELESQVSATSQG